MLAAYINAQLNQFITVCLFVYFLFSVPFQPLYSFWVSSVPFSSIFTVVMSCTGFSFLLLSLSPSLSRCKWLWTAICYLATLQRVGLHAHLLCVCAPSFMFSCTCAVTVFSCACVFIYAYVHMHNTVGYACVCVRAEEREDGLCWGCVFMPTCTCRTCIPVLVCGCESVLHQCSHI